MTEAAPQPNFNILIAPATTFPQLRGYLQTTLGTGLFGQPVFVADQLSNAIHGESIFDLEDGYEDGPELASGMRGLASTLAQSGVTQITDVAGMYLFVEPNLRGAVEFLQEPPNISLEKSTLVEP